MRATSADAPKEKNGAISISTRKQIADVSRANALALVVRPVALGSVANLVKPQHPFDGSELQQ